MEKEAITAQYSVRAEYLKILENLSSDREKMQLVSRFMNLDPKDLIGTKEFIAQLFYLGELEKQEEIANNLLKVGFRPAFFKEMLAFLDQYPDFKKISMVAYNSGVWFNECEYFHPISYYDKDKDLWMLGHQCFTCCLQLNIKKCYFLAVKI
ncbi:MAG: hypothetical protein ACOX0H_00470 [Patescibacteria group bacterium]|jgi:hypothetical protein|nr:MAG: hypothetical protein BWY03_00438 [Parcubacteria group bacterium ADurb.Bin159]HPY08643.1 hypothetical protein [bacterium]HQC49766.1 hypothetical protein [bacterium]